MRLYHRITSLWIALLILFALVPGAAAAPQIDPERNGSITVGITYGGRPVSGGSVTLFRLASLEQDGTFVPEGKYAQAGVDLNETLTAAKIRTLVRFTQDQKLTGRRVAIGPDGKAVFSDLKTGLYLLIQEEAAEGFLPINSFVVSIPMVIGDDCWYDVDASPKTDTLPIPTDPTDPTTPTTPTGPKPPGLPQTGQTNWPIPVLGIMGLLLIAMGLILCFGKRRMGHEA